MRKLFAIILLLSLSATARSQVVYKLQGTLIDSALNRALSNASIVVVRATDSILCRFDRSDSDGRFSLTLPQAGNYIAIITYPKYADYIERFTLSPSKQSYDMHTVSLELESKLLAEVIVKSKRLGMRVKGDTTEFDPRAYDLPANATVEDLLKKLQGIQVDRNGKITAQGQTVNTVLVDGEEFFGDDPTLVTRNLRADIIDKVQLYDKTSDQATFTGIDDGKKSKTINLTLRKDRKNGQFGNADAGIGTDRYYQSRLMLNDFSGDMKMSVFGTLGNTGRTGLGWRDNSKYGFSDDDDIADDGSGIVMFSGGGEQLDSFNGYYDGVGIPIASTAGAHYDDKWANGTQSLNTNYKIGYLDVKGTSNTITQESLPAEIIDGASNEDFDKSTFRQKLDLIYKVKLDTMSTLKVVLGGTIKSTNTLSDYNSVDQISAGTDLSTDSRNLATHANIRLFNLDALYEKKFRKSGRKFSIAVSESQNRTDGQQQINSLAHFFTPGSSLDTSQTINQNKKIILNNSILLVNSTYSEPLTKSVSAVVNYGFGVGKGESNIQTFNAGPFEQYTSLVDSLSNSYKLTEVSNQAGVTLAYVKSKTTLDIGTKVTDVSYDQADLIMGGSLRRAFLNWTPVLRYQFRFSPQQTLTASYRGSTTLPTIEQLQPVIVNDDPLHLIVGNPHLNPFFTNDFELTYNSYSITTQQSVFFFSSYKLATSPIVSSVATDSTGRTISTYSNLPGHQRQSLSLFGSISRTLEKPNLTLGLEANIDGHSYYSLSNDLDDYVKFYTYSTDVTVSKDVQNKYAASFSIGPSYTASSSSLSPLASNGLGIDSHGSLDIYLPKNITLSSDLAYQYRAPTAVFNTSLHKAIWNATIKREFFKSKALKIQISCDDILNQNVGFYRNISENFITQDSYTTIRRYLMASVGWNFSQFKVKHSTSDNK